MALSAAPSMEFAEPTLVVIRVVSGSELEPLARELCIRLNQYYGISCILSVADDESAGGRSWVRESMCGVRWKKKRFSNVVRQFWFLLSLLGHFCTKFTPR
jgi:hypothetical protein